MPKVVTAPGEWHPAWESYRTFLTKWLQGQGTCGKYPVIRLPAGTNTPWTGYRTLEKHKAGGPAPYVGKPFMYTWIVGIDDLGRAVATEAEIRYLPREEVIT